MTISKDKVVSIHYILTDNNGQTIDSSENRPPLTYLHGVGQLIGGLEKALEGKSIGDKLEKVTISPEEGYGMRDNSLVREVPKSNFPEGDIQVGMQFRAQTDKGTAIFTVIELKADTVLIDGNHPLAGITLNFAVEIVDLRAATPQEIEQRQVHVSGEH